VEHDDKAGQQLSYFVFEETNKEVFVSECDTTPLFAKKYFGNLHLIQGETKKSWRSRSTLHPLVILFQAVFSESYFLTHKFFGLEAR